MDLLKIFPLSRKVERGKASSLIKATALYVACMVGALIIATIVEFIPVIGFVSYIMVWLVEVYTSIGMVLTVLLFAMESREEKENADAGNTGFLGKVTGIAILILAACIFVDSFNLIPAAHKKAPVKQESVETNEKEPVAENPVETNEEDGTNETITQEAETVTDATPFEPAVEKFVPGEQLGETELDGLKFAIYDNGAEVIDVTGIVTQYVIPERIDYDGNSYEVKAIGNAVFNFDPGVESIIMADTITTVGTASIKNCKFMTSLYISENLTYVGEEAFSGNEGLENIFIPASVYEIGEGTFCWNYGTPVITDEAQYQFLLGQNSQLMADYQPGKEQKKPSGQEKELSETQQKFRDFTFHTSIADIRFQYNNYFEIFEVAHLNDANRKYSSHVEVKLYGIDSHDTEPHFYFADASLYDTLADKAKYTGENCYFVTEADVEIKNAFVCKRDGFTVLVVWPSDDFKPSFTDIGLQNMERYCERAQKMSEVFTIADSSPESTDIFAWVRARYNTFGKYHMKEDTVINRIKRDVYRSDNGSRTMEDVYYLSLSSPENVSYPLSYYVSENENEYLMESGPVYGTSAYPGVQAVAGSCLGYDYVVMLIAEEYGVDFSNYPENYQDLTMEQYYELFLALSMPSFITVEEEIDGTIDMNDCKTIRLFGEMFE